MTHEYTVLLGGVVETGLGRPVVSALAWAHDTVLALGSDDGVRAISRGDSRFVELGGARVVPDAPLEVGGPATFSILAPRPDDPGAAAATGSAVLAVVRDGAVVEGHLPGIQRGPSDSHAP